MKYSKFTFLNDNNLKHLIEAVFKKNSARYGSIAKIGTPQEDKAQQQFPIDEEGLKKFKEILDKQGKLISSGVLTDKEAEHLAKYTRIKKLKAGEVLFDAGDKAKTVYLLHEGELVAQRNVKDNKTFQVSIKPGKFIGEHIVMFNKNRHVAVLAKEDSTCLALSKSDYMNYIVKKKRDRFLVFFNTIELFKHTKEIAKIIGSYTVAVEIYGDGESIIKQVDFLPIILPLSIRDCLCCPACSGAMNQPVLGWDSTLTFGHFFNFLTI